MLYDSGLEYDMKKESEFAKRHPAVILVYLLACMIWTMIVRHPAAIMVSFVCASLCYVALAGIIRWLQLWIPAGMMLVFAAVILPLFSHRGVTPLFYMNGMAVTWESVYYGIMMTAMLFALLLWCGGAACLLDSEKVLYITGKTIPTIGLMLMMIFRSIPDMRDRYRQIHEAQIGLGCAGGEASKMQRMRSFLRELSMLISWSLEDSIEVSVSMESRGYRTGSRTWFHLFSFHREDLVWCIYFVVMFAGVYICRFRGDFKAYYFPEIWQKALSGWSVAALVTAAAGMLAPVAYDSYFLMSVRDMGQMGDGEKGDA